MSEIEQDAIEAPSDLDQVSYTLEADDDLDDNTDELAESSTAQEDDIDTSSVSAEEEAHEDVRAMNSDRNNQRYSEITARAKEAEADAKVLKAQVLALEARFLSEPDVQPFDAPEPTAEQFDYDDDQLQAARIAHFVAKESHQRQASERQASTEAHQMRAQQALFDSHQDKRQRLLAKEPKLGEALSQMQLNNQTQGGNATAEAILRIENGAEVEFHLATNPQLAVAFNQMDSYLAIAEVNRLSEQLKVKPKKSAALPEPVGSTPSGGGRSTDFKAVFSAGATYE